jgi:hypothetical protein
MTRFVVPVLLVAGALTCVAQDCSTDDNAMVGGVPVAAAASFAIDNGVVTVTLSNLMADPRSAGQLLNGVAFTLSSGLTVGTLGDSSAPIRKVQDGGTYVDLGVQPTGWALMSNVNGGLGLCVLCTNLGAPGPKRLLIGAPGPSNTYASANASIAGNKPHNPFTTDQATFVINVPGAMFGDKVTSLSFSFSTAAGMSVTGSCRKPIE